MAKEIITLENLDEFKAAYDNVLDERIPEGVKELSTQYVRITDLETGIYKLTYNGTKYLYHCGKTSTTSHSVAVGAVACLLYVQKYSTTWWEWHYFYSTETSVKKIVVGSTGTSSGTASTLLFPTSSGTRGYYFKSNGTSSAPSWVKLPVPADFGTSGQYLKSSGSNTAPTWASAPTPDYYPIYTHFGTGLTLKGLGDLTSGDTTIGYKVKITSITGTQPPKIYPTAATFCFWYGSIKTEALYVNQNSGAQNVTDLTFAISSSSYLAYMLKNSANNEVSFDDYNAFVICGHTGNYFSMTPPSYCAM